MPRNRRLPSDQAPANPPAPSVPIVDPHAVFFLDQFVRTFRLRDTTVRREWKEGRLRLAKRAGRIFILGRWALEWLESGEAKPKARTSA